MQAKNLYEKYSANNVYTAPKEELTLMLYDGALKFINQAIKANEEKDYTKSNELVIRVQDIIRELQVTLDPKYEISKQISPLYDYIIAKTREGNMKKDNTALSEARELIREFRDTWKEAMLLAKRQRAAQ